MENENTKPNVRVYSTSNCPYCFTLKEFLKENDIEFEDIDISQDEKAQKEIIKKSGQIGVPVIEIGEEIIAGFDREKICKILNIK